MEAMPPWHLRRFQVRSNFHKYKGSKFARICHAADAFSPGGVCLRDLVSVAGVAAAAFGGFALLLGEKKFEIFDWAPGLSPSALSPFGEKKVEIFFCPPVMLLGADIY